MPRMKKIIVIITLLSVAYGNPPHRVIMITDSSHTKGVNIYLISKDRYFDLTNRIIVWQARLAALFHPKLKVIMAYSTIDAEKKIETLVKKHHYSIDNLWFDSHGKYRKGYSSFMIGNDEYSYKNIADSVQMANLKKIASFCNANTLIGLGACYAAADFNFPVPSNGHIENMHGDSLVRGLGAIFSGNMIYACKSWVMAKPWIFGSEHALAGFPLDRQYKDIIFLPVWKSMGEWHRYSTLTQKIEVVHTIYLSAEGGIRLQPDTYLEKKKAQRKLKRNLRKLRPGLYNLNG